MISLQAQNHDFHVVQHDFNSLHLNTLEDIEDHLSGSDSDDLELGYAVFSASPMSQQSKLLDEPAHHEQHRIVGWFGPSKQKQLNALKHCIDLLTQPERP
eukprot:170336-Hanusia_phi.AAC.1